MQVTWVNVQIRYFGKRSEPFAKGEGFRARQREALPSEAGRGLGGSPQRGPGAAPLAGARGRSPRKIFSIKGGLEAILAIRNIKIIANCVIKNCKIIAVLYCNKTRNSYEMTL